MKCQVDENKWCERHQTRHVGRLYELSQMENELGEKYRKSWDDELTNNPPKPQQPKKPCNCKKKNKTKKIAKRSTDGIIYLSPSNK